LGLHRLCAVADQTISLTITRSQTSPTTYTIKIRTLSVLDPVMTGFRPTRNAAYLVFDTLYGMDTEWRAQPQMVEGHVVEEDGLTWTLTGR